MSKYLRYAGIAASAVLIVFGVASMIIGVNGRSTVRDNLAAEKIVGSDDMTPTGIAAAAKATPVARSPCAEKHQVSAAPMLPSWLAIGASRGPLSRSSRR